jgi:hypothetical protein
VDWAYVVERIASRYEDAEKIILVMDNLNTHVPGSLYEAFPPEKAKALWDRFEFRVCLHTEARKLAEHGRDRIERSDRAVPEPPDCQS